MSEEPRFQFPAFILREVQDTDTHQVEVGVIEDGGHAFLVTLIRSITFSDRPFLIAAVRDGNNIDAKPLWIFQKDCPSKDYVALPAHTGEQAVIAYVGRGRTGMVERVIPLTSLVKPMQIGARTTLALKKAAADFLGVQANTREEDDALRAIGQRKNAERATQRAAEREAEAARQAAEREARERARVARIRSIMSRDVIDVYSADGADLWGYPVTQNEWPMLPHDTYVVLVESYNDETSEHGNVLEAFRIVHQHGKNPTKGFAKTVTERRPVATATESRISSREIWVEMGDDAYAVQLYPSMELIQQARKQGLNSGTFAAVEPAKDASKIQIFSVHHDEIKTVGNFVI
jgi:hypothetical protein